MKELKITSKLDLQHGGLTPDGMIPDKSVLDLSVNVNPYGPHPELMEFLANVAFSHYPDPHCWQSRQALAQWQGCEAQHIIIGNGANELLWAAARSHLSKDTVWLSVEPNYSEFARAAKQLGAKQINFHAAPQQLFRWHPEQLADSIEKWRPQVVLMSQPCSPTGFALDSAKLFSLFHAYPNISFIIDQSFLSSSRCVDQYPNSWPEHVLRIRSLTKDFSLAGLRLGFAQGSVERIQRLSAEIPTWSVNSLAQQACLWIGQHARMIDASRQRWLEDHQHLEAQLQIRNIVFAPSQTPFTMFFDEDSLNTVDKLWQDHRILVRSCASYGLSSWIRIAARPQASMQRFWQALDRVKS